MRAVRVGSSMRLTGVIASDTESAETDDNWQKMCLPTPAVPTLWIQKGREEEEVWVRKAWWSRSSEML